MFHGSAQQGPLTPSGCEERVPLAARRVSDSLRNRPLGKFPLSQGQLLRQAAAALSQFHRSSSRADTARTARMALRFIDDWADETPWRTRIQIHFLSLSKIIVGRCARTTELSYSYGIYSTR